MIVTVHQPDFLPWLGFFDRWHKSDLFVVLDDVQFIRRGWHHRDKIKTAQGPKWLTVPVLKKGRYFQQIKDVEIDNNENWRRTHLSAIRSAYGKAPHFEAICHDIEEIFTKNYELLIHLNMDLLKYCAAALGINTPFCFSSSLHNGLKGTQRLVHLVKAAGGDVYLTGLGSKDYLDESKFAEHGIKVWWQHYEHPVYPQPHGKFAKMLSVLDFLMIVTDPQSYFS